MIPELKEAWRGSSGELAAKKLGDDWEIFQKTKWGGVGQRRRPGVLKATFRSQVCSSLAESLDPHHKDLVAASDPGWKAPSTEEALGTPASYVSLGPETPEEQCSHLLKGTRTHRRTPCTSWSLAGGPLERPGMVRLPCEASPSADSRQGRTTQGSPEPRLRSAKPRAPFPRPGTQTRRSSTPARPNPNPSAASLPGPLQGYHTRDGRLCQPAWHSPPPPG